MQPKWFRIDAKADEPSTVDFYIIDYIGSWDDDWFARNFGYDMGVTARAFVEALSNLSADVKTIRLHINSPGGDVQAGVNIANALRDQQVSKGRAVHTFIEGIAASIASVIAMAGETVTIGDNALMMIHNPYAVAIGTAAEMRKTADILDTVRGQIIATYKWHSTLDADAIATLMDAETWMDADEAIANGFATAKQEGLHAAAAFNPKSVARMSVPARFRDRVDALTAPREEPPAAMAADAVLQACEVAGLDLAFARQLIAAKASTAQVSERVTQEQRARTTATARADEITALCAMSKLPELAAGYIAGAMSVADVRVHVTTFTAKLDRLEIDGTLGPDHRTSPKTGISAAAIYAERNRPSAH